MDFKMILSVISYSITRIRIKCGYLHFLNKNVTCIHANWKTETLVQIVQYLLLFTYNKIDNPVQTRPPPSISAALVSPTESQQTLGKFKPTLSLCVLGSMQNIIENHPARASAASLEIKFQHGCHFEYCINVHIKLGHY